MARLLTPLYLAELGRRNRRFDRGAGVTRFDVPVISVGNISVGGVGKTPMVMTIAGWLLESGRRPCIAMRGYKAGAGESDEAALYRERFGDVPVVAQPDRTAGLRALFAQERVGQASSLPGPGARIDCIILDDGFQHRQIARDLDIVLIDATHDPFADRPLPAGWLREPVSALARAGAIVITHAEAVEPKTIDELRARIADITGAPIAVTRHTWQRLRVAEADGAERIERRAWLVGRRIVAACAIGNPEAFLRAAGEAVGASGEVTGSLVLRDHDPFSEKTVGRLIALARQHTAEAIVLTAKDWAKLAKVDRLRWPAPVVVAELGTEFVSGDRDLQTLVRACVDRSAAR